MMRIKTILLPLTLIALTFAACKQKPPTLVDKIKKAEAKMKAPNYTRNDKDLTEMLNLYQRFADSLPNDPKAPICLVKSSDFYGTLKMHDKQIALYKKVLEKYPDFQDADMVMYLLASALDSDLNDRVQAKKYYELYIQKYPNSIYIPDAKSRLTNIDSLSFKELQDKIIHQELEQSK